MILLAGHEYTYFKVCERMRKILIGRRSAPISKTRKIKAFPVSCRPFQRVHSDIVGLLPFPFKGHVHFDSYMFFNKIRNLQLDSQSENIHHCKNFRQRRYMQIRDTKTTCDRSRFKSYQRAIRKNLLLDEKNWKEISRC